MQATKPPEPAPELGALARLEQALISSAKRVLGKGRPAASGRPPARGHHVERAGYFALAGLQDHGQVRLSELATALELDVSTVSRQVRLLEGWGLLERSPDPQDGRASLLGLSDAGREVLHEQRQDRHDRLERALSAWSDTDRQQLLALLERLSADLGATLPPTHPLQNREVPA